MPSSVLVFILLLAFTVQPSTSAAPCSIPTPYVNFTAEQSVYLSATRVNISQQAQIIQLYQSVSQIDTYIVSIESSYAIYPNDLPTCRKDTTVVKTYSARNDLWLCFDQFFLLTCNEVWELVIKCGTFIEVHRPFHPQVIAQLNLETAAWILDSAGEEITNMGIRSLCAGTYHLWFVYYSRMGKFLEGVKTIYVSSPSCSC